MPVITFKYYCYYSSDEGKNVLTFFFGWGGSNDPLVVYLSCRVIVNFRRETSALKPSVLLA